MEVNESMATTPIPEVNQDPYAAMVSAQEAFEFAPQARLRTDGHGIIREANHAASALLRCPKEFLSNKPLGLFLMEGQRARFYDYLSRLWRGFFSDSFETRVARRDDSPRDVAVVVNANRTENAEIGKGTLDVHWWLTDISDQKKAEIARDELLRRLMTAQEDERRRVSRELHDSVGQLLAALALAIKAAREVAPLPASTDTRLNWVQRITNELSQVVRNLTTRLRPIALDELGLQAALAQFIEEWSEQTKIVVEKEFVGTTPRLPAEIENAIFRVVQESLTNIVRHAQARNVSVVVSLQEDHATVCVEDDGIGFDVDAAFVSRRLGLVGMQERINLAGGTLDIESKPGEGTAVLARFSLPKKRQ
jgi:signal transduction histidine kinase